VDRAAATENYTVVVLQKLSARAGREAIVAGDRRVSGSEAVATVLRFAAALRGSGLAEGDGVALFAENSPEVLLLQLAVHFVGCRLVFVPPVRGSIELEALIERADVKALVFDPVFEERTRQIAGRVDIPHLFSIGASSIAPDFLEAASGRAGLSLADAADGRHIATLFYTGGTTGLPKLVIRRSRHYNGQVQRSGMHIDHVSDSPALLVCTLVTYSSGHNLSLLGILSGHVIVLLRTFDAGTALSVMESERVTRMIVATPMIYDLLDHPDCRPGRFPALRLLTYTGASPSPARLLQAVERFGPVLQQLYAATETGIVAHLTPEEHDPRRPGLLSSCGRLMPGVEVEVRGDDGKPVPAGQPSELFIRSGAVMEGYWNDPERTAGVLDDQGWYRSGDIARQDEDGYLYIVGRARDVIVSGRTAANVYSQLLDDFLTAQPSIKDAAAIGLPGDDGKETVHVVLVPQDPASPPTFPG
jgi:fatty-acyl-CoA synthase